MRMRTSKKTVTFRRPFVLGGFNEELPAGAYTVETDEELLEGISFPVYRRILTVIHLPAKPGYPGLTQTVAADPNELDAALMRDQAPGEVLACLDAGQAALTGTADSRSSGTDHQAMERGEDEAMTVHAGRTTTHPKSSDTDIPKSEFQSGH